MNKTKAIEPKINPQRVPRERRMDHNTVSRPKRAKVRVLADSPTETVEQFEARGGQLQRLPASWERGA
ncbi:hypothetical protein ROV96_19420 [Stenotrophomonas pavanii]|uniref:hypothetical protein n=1 Tax=Stenotrophomonas pavanii TaxID=487698 RepID=UPI0028961B61|nr:hypothetical protein [Stenotrophomonas pavanii]MDT3457379.1 hypothetical protein [Stenotrophomonas pavanii]MDT3466109.1 hypothetical protein [Stenotrophomonas pavanii]